MSLGPSAAVFSDKYLQNRIDLSPSSHVFNNLIPSCTNFKIKKKKKNSNPTRIKKMIWGAKLSNYFSGFGFIGRKFGDDFLNISGSNSGSHYSNSPSTSSRLSCFYGGNGKWTGEFENLSMGLLWIFSMIIEIKLLAGKMGEEWFSEGFLVTCVLTSIFQK